MNRVEAALNSPRPEQREDYIRSLFIDTVSSIGSDVILELIDVFEQNIIEGMDGVVAFPDTENSHVIAVRRDGLIHVQCQIADYTERFNLPIDEARKLAEAVANKDPNEPLA